MGLETSPDSPIQVEKASNLMRDWIRRLGSIWVEGQIAQLRVRRSYVWITLRDTDADVSIPLGCSRSEIESADGGITEGQRVVVYLKPDYSMRRGDIQWRATDFRPVGLGELLARIERLKKLLAAEGIFAEERKRPLPFLPRRIGLVCGRASAAQHDVEVNARLRWPGALFEVREVPVQGPSAVAQVIAAITDLDQTPEVDVIVVTRGGGSVEDLLPFSNEALVRAVAACATPIVSAIGHEDDVPLLDLVADLRASTPTDAGKRIVPSLKEETAKVADLRERAHTALETRVRTERRHLTSLTSRPAMSRPGALVDRERASLRLTAERGRRSLRSRVVSQNEKMTVLLSRPAFAHPELAIARRVDLLAGLRDRCARAFSGQWQATVVDLQHQTARLQSLSPLATLDRGYSVVESNGVILRDSSEVALGSKLRIRLSRGQLGAVTTSVRQ
ncbi:MAG: exodeoxyribonuclease VII large subunit [Candidatus Nanopelagicales bacterium]|nr:exodeoxyribonuclease VII large subunit [Candidatus Nanopelagicales bacterium]MDZ4249317.1 exodeoxyribonuclease VII large subunit [Candidatus Nanopelagicales bacterium]